MKLVTITADMTPFRAGTDYPVPDAVAEQLVREDAAKDPRPWPPATEKPAERPRRRGYLTKGA